MKIIVAILCAAPLVAQSAPADKLQFDVASVKQNKSDDRPNANFPLGPGNVYIPNGGRFSATGFPLVTYIAFAWKLTGYQLDSLVSQLPGWATTDHFSIEARADGNPTKDQMRLMMRSLLQDRFRLAMHTELRQSSVYGLALLKPGKTGPQLVPHPSDAACTSTAPPPATPGGTSAPFVQTVAGGFPLLCGGIFGMPPSAPGRLRAGARNINIALLASLLVQIGGLGRPVVDQTGLSGPFDFTFEWTPELTGPPPPGADFTPDPSGPTFGEALREQLGLRLDSQKGPVDVLVVDHVERPSEN